MFTRAVFFGMLHGQKILDLWHLSMQLHGGLALYYQSQHQRQIPIVLESST